MPTQEQVVDVIKQVYDPEIPVNVYDLGLIYTIDAKEDSVRITMSLTSQGCPSAQQIPGQIKQQLIQRLNVPNVQVDVVWDPPWNPERISTEGRKALGIEI